MRSFAERQGQHFKRLGVRQPWQKNFEEAAVLLSRVAFTATFPHDHTVPVANRTIATAAGARKYVDLVRWIAVPTLTGCPSTVAPVGRGDSGLPIGLQIMGPFWEDATSI